MSPEEIRTARESMRLTQKRFAELLNVSPNTVARWERGERIPHPAVPQLIRILLEERTNPLNHV